MRIIKIPNFITEAEHKSIADWGADNRLNAESIILTRDKQLITSAEVNDETIIDVISVITQSDVMMDVSRRIEQTFDFGNNYLYNEPPKGLPFLLESQVGGGLRMHTDPTTSEYGDDSAVYDLPPGWDILRANVLINKATSGGIFRISIDEQDCTGDNTRDIPIDERDLVVFCANKTPHEVTTVEGNNGRLMYLTSVGVERGIYDKLKPKEGVEYIEYVF